MESGSGEEADEVDETVERLRECVEEGLTISLAEGGVEFLLGDVAVPKDKKCRCPWVMKKPSSKGKEHATLAALVFMVQYPSGNTWSQYSAASNDAGVSGLSLWSWNRAKRYFGLNRSITSSREPRSWSPRRRAARSSPSGRPTSVSPHRTTTSMNTTAPDDAGVNSVTSVTSGRSIAATSIVRSELSPGGGHARAARNTCGDDESEESEVDLKAAGDAADLGAASASASPTDFGVTGGVGYCFGDVVNETSADDAENTGQEVVGAVSSSSPRCIRRGLAAVQEAREGSHPIVQACLGPTGAVEISAVTGDADGDKVDVGDGSTNAFVGEGRADAASAAGTIPLGTFPFTPPHTVLHTPLPPATNHVHNVGGNSDDPTRINQPLMPQTLSRRLLLPPPPGLSHPTAPWAANTFRPTVSTSFSQSEFAALAATPTSIPTTATIRDPAEAAAVAMTVAAVAAATGGARDAELSDTDSAQSITITRDFARRQEEACRITGEAVAEAVFALSASPPPSPPPTPAAPPTSPALWKPFSDASCEGRSEGNAPRTFSPGSLQRDLQDPSECFDARRTSPSEVGGSSASVPASVLPGQQVETLPAMADSGETDNGVVGKDGDELREAMVASTQDDVMQLGAIVCTRTGRLGTVKFCGETEFTTGTCLGIELHGRGGNNDGSYLLRRYFTCPHGRGLFVHADKVVLVSKAEGEAAEGGEIGSVDTEPDAAGVLDTGNAAEPGFSGDGRTAPLSSPADATDSPNREVYKNSRVLNAEKRSPLSPRNSLNSADGVPCPEELAAFKQSGRGTTDVQAVLVMERREDDEEAAKALMGGEEVLLEQGVGRENDVEDGAAVNAESETMAGETGAVDAATGPLQKLSEQRQRASISLATAWSSPTGEGDTRENGDDRNAEPTRRPEIRRLSSEDSAAVDRLGEMENVRLLSPSTNSPPKPGANDGISALSRGGAISRAAFPDGCLSANTTDWSGTEAAAIASPRFVKPQILDECGTTSSIHPAPRPSPSAEPSGGGEPVLGGEPEGAEQAAAFSDLIRGDASAVAAETQQTLPGTTAVSGGDDRVTPKAAARTGVSRLRSAKRRTRFAIKSPPAFSEAKAAGKAAAATSATESACPRLKLNGGRKDDNTVPSSDVPSILSPSSIVPSSHFEAGSGSARGEAKVSAVKTTRHSRRVASRNDGADSGETVRTETSRSTEGPRLTEAAVAVHYTRTSDNAARPIRGVSSAPLASAVVAGSMEDESGPVCAEELPAQAVIRREGGLRISKGWRARRCHVGGLLVAVLAGFAASVGSDTKRDFGRVVSEVGSAVYRGLNPVIGGVGRAADGVGHLFGKSRVRDPLVARTVGVLEALVDMTGLHGAIGWMWNELFDGFGSTGTSDSPISSGDTNDEHLPVFAEHSKPSSLPGGDLLTPGGDHTVTDVRSVAAEGNLLVTDSEYSAAGMSDSGYGDGPDIRDEGVDASVDEVANLETEGKVEVVAMEWIAESSSASLQTADLPDRREGAGATVLGEGSENSGDDALGLDAGEDAQLPHQVAIAKLAASLPPPTDLSYTGDRERLGVWYERRGDSADDIADTTGKADAEALDTAQLADILALAAATRYPPHFPAISTPFLTSAVFREDHSDNPSEDEDSAEETAMNDRRADENTRGDFARQPEESNGEVSESTELSRWWPVAPSDDTLVHENADRRGTSKWDAEDNPPTWKANEISFVHNGFEDARHQGRLRWAGHQDDPLLVELPENDWRPYHVCEDDWSQCADPDVRSAFSRDGDSERFKPEFQPEPEFLWENGSMVQVIFLTQCGERARRPSSSEGCIPMPMALGHDTKNDLVLRERGIGGELMWRSRKSSVTILKKAFWRMLSPSQSQPPEACANVYLSARPDQQLVLLFPDRSARDGGISADFGMVVGFVENSDSVKHAADRKDQHVVMLAPRGHLCVFSRGGVVRWVSRGVNRWSSYTHPRGSSLDD